MTKEDFNIILATSEKSSNNELSNEAKRIHPTSNFHICFTGSNIDVQFGSLLVVRLTSLHHDEPPNPVEGRHLAIHVEGRCVLIELYFGFNLVTKDPQLRFEVEAGRDVNVQ